MAVYPQGAGPDLLYDRGVALELGHTTDGKPPFKYAAYTRVGFSDTDAQGIVYYGRYLPYFDLARVEYHRHLELLSVDREHELVMRASSVEYLAPARFDDLLEVFVRVSAIGRTSVTYDCAAYRVDDDALTVTARQTLVLVDLEERRARPIPEAFKERIAAFEGDDLALLAAGEKASGTR
jgi:acyl-CoA thioester hydrolase